MPVLYPEELDASKVILSQQSYSYGPTGKMLFADYGEPRHSADVLFGPFQSTFGLSSFQGDVSKTSISVRVPAGNPLLAAMQTFETGLKEVLAKTPASLPIPMTVDNIERAWTPTLSNTMFGYDMRFQVKTNADGLLKALFLKRSFTADGNTTTENVTGLPKEELFELFGPKSMVYVLARLGGIAVSKTAGIQVKFSAVQLIHDSTIVHEAAIRDDVNYSVPLDDKYFQMTLKPQE